MGPTVKLKDIIKIKGMKIFCTGNQYKAALDQQSLSLGLGVQTLRVTSFFLRYETFLLSS